MGRRGEARAGRAARKRGEGRERAIGGAREGEHADGRADGRKQSGEGRGRTTCTLCTRSRSKPFCRNSGRKRHLALLRERPHTGKCIGVLSPSRPKKGRYARAAHDSHARARTGTHTRKHTETHTDIGTHGRRSTDTATGTRAHTDAHTPYPKPAAPRRARALSLARAHARVRGRIRVLAACRMCEQARWREQQGREEGMALGGREKAGGGGRAEGVYSAAVSSAESPSAPGPTSCRRSGRGAIRSERPATAAHAIGRGRFSDQGSHRTTPWANCQGVRARVCALCLRVFCVNVHVCVRARVCARVYARACVQARHVCVREGTS